MMHSQRSTTCKSLRSTCKQPEMTPETPPPSIGNEFVSNRQPLP